MIFFFDRRISVISVTEQRQNLTEQPCTKRRTASFKGILSAFQAFNCRRMKNHLRIRYCKNLIQKTRMIVMCVRQEYVSDFFRLDMILFQHLHKMRKPVCISCVYQNIACFGRDQIGVDDPAAKILGFEYSSDQNVQF